MIPNVLIVNNDREMLTTLEEEFAKYDDIFTVLTAEDGQAAVDVLRHDTVSLVVTDLKVPRIDGLGLLKHVMEGYPEIPVIVITAYSAPEMERLVREGGAAGILHQTVPAGESGPKDHDPFKS